MSTPAPAPSPSSVPLLEKHYSDFELEESPSTSSSTTHSRSPSLISPPGGWCNAVSRRFAQRNFTRRALVVTMLSLVAVVTLFASLTQTPRQGESDDETGWSQGWRTAFEQRWNTFGRSSETSKDRQEMKKLNLLNVINFETPQPTLYSQFKQGVRYATAMSYGGHANQMISIQKLLYFAKITNRVPIIPSLIPVHIDGGPQNISTFYDLPRFFHLTSLPALEMSQLKTAGGGGGGGGGAVQQEDFPCWSVQESTVGFPNREAISFDLHGLFVHHWPLPGHTFARGAGGFDLSFDALRVWDSDVWGKDRWIEKVRTEYLPQQTRKDEKGNELPEFEQEDAKRRKGNIKEGFATWEAPAPTDQIVAFDNSLFLGPIMFPPIDLSPDSAPLEPSLAGEGTSWIEIGQHLHFTPLVESRATSYLLRLFDVRQPSEIPPFITVHLRRGDFEEFTGSYTSLEKYKDALKRLLPRLQQRLDDPDSFSGPSHEAFLSTHHSSSRSSSSSLRASSYSIVATTDEASSSPFVKAVRDLGWKVVDHELFRTKQELGGWWPTLLDCAILARGLSFVGTDRSTYTHLAALRVKYWNGGVVEIA